MLRSQSYQAIILVLLFFMLFRSDVLGQGTQARFRTRTVSFPSRVQDSMLAVRIPLLQLPEKYRNRMIPSQVDNTTNKYWPGMLDQFLFFTCQQYAGVAYVFGYEINRLRDRYGWYWENSYPTHYTWNFMNQGGRYVGVDFLQSFEAIRQQGHLTSNDYGIDTATGYTGWINGYDKYYRGMSNRIRQVSAIRVNSAEGIHTLRQYLYDHLDGSPTGGTACFTTDSYSLYFMQTIPAASPEAGKSIVVSWTEDPNHGLAVVGYNDSIRFDLNSDGKFTNDEDINGDGIVDARDWEIGAFKLANSYGGDWGDHGCVYALYSSFANNYSEGGIWNDRVYVVEPDTACQPLLTLKVNLRYNLRDRIRILAGVSTDTTKQMPEQVMDFPIFDYQGGEHVMQGWDTVPGADTLEFGLDVTPLLNMVPAGQPARYFLAVEERDPDQSGFGEIRKASFISYRNGVHEYPLKPGNAEINDNTVTFVSTVASPDKPLVQITTTSLPPVTPPQPYQVQLAASGGKTPYSWNLDETYAHRPVTGAMPQITGTSLLTFSTRPYQPVVLPFSFPFFGQKYDTIYVNFSGFITFEPQCLPGSYTTDEVSMLRMIRCISPAFSQYLAYLQTKNDGVFVQATSACVAIRWKASMQQFETSTTYDFALLLYPDGCFEFRYGTMESQVIELTCYSGVSKGDGINHEIMTDLHANELSGRSIRYMPQDIPAGLTLTGQGLLKIEQFDSTRISDIHVRVTDAGRISAAGNFVLSDGLGIGATIAGQEDNRPEYGKPNRLKLVVTNTGTRVLGNVVIRFRGADSLLNITDSLYTIASLAPAQTVTVPEAFSFSLKNRLPDDFPLQVTLLAKSGERSWTKEALFAVSGPVMEIETPQLKDGYDGLLDPGEVADLLVTVKNTGSEAVDDLKLQLISADTLLTVVSASTYPIGHANPMSLLDFTFKVKASRFASPGTDRPMQLFIKDSTGILCSMNFSLKMSKKPVALVRLSRNQADLKAMMTALDSLNVAYDTLNALPFDYPRYSSVFLLLGTGEQGYHTLTDYEASTLADYLIKHGNLYMEGYLTWHYTSKTPLHPFFKYTTSLVSAYTYQAVNGIPSTFADSMSFSYGASLNHAVFTFNPVSPAYATLVGTDTLNRNFEIVYNGSDYKTIGTFLGFSGLGGAGYPSTQKNLMKKYLEFFGLNITGPYPLFHADSTKICTGQSVAFTDDSWDHILSRSWEFPGGTPAADTSASPVIKYNAEGTYDVKLTVSDGRHAKSILKQGFITVENHTGTPEAGEVAGFRVFPNPASEMVTVEATGQAGGSFSCALFDMTGRKFREKRAEGAGNRITFNLSGLKKGLWILKMQSGDGTACRRLLVY